MIRPAYSFLLLFFAFMIETLLENSGIRAVLIAPVIFYLTFAFGQWYGVACSILAGCALDFCFGAENPWSVLCFLLVTAFAVFWLHHSETDTMLPLVIPGAVIPFLSRFPADVIHSGFSSEVILDSFLDSLLCSFFTAILFPLMVVVLDWIGAFLSLELFADAGERLRNRKTSLPSRRLN